MANFVSYSDATDLMSGISAKLKALNSAYVTRGNSTFANLPSVLTKNMSGYVYNITDEFTTDSRFVDGAGKTCPAGTNVVIVDNGSVSYSAVTPAGTENPSEEGWYEKSAGVYTLSADTAVDGSKTYYEQTVTVDMKFDVIGTFVDVSAVYAEIEKVSGMITAEEFDNTETYEVGDIVKYQNTLYKFKSVHAAGDWDSTEVDAVTVLDLIAAAKAVVDSALNSTSTNPVQNKIVKESLDSKVDKVAGMGLSKNSYTNEEKNKLAGLENYDDSAVKSQIGELADAGAKNLLKVDKPTATVNGVTFTVNDDSSITINGTATGGNATFTITDGWSIPTEVGKKYTASLISGTTDVYMPLYDTSWAGPNVIDSYDFTENSPSGRLARIVVKNGTVVDNLTVYPMVCTAEAYEASSVYTPYAPSNYELYKMILALQNQNGG